MELKNLFKLSVLAAAITLVGCGGDINVNTGQNTAPAPNPSPTPDTKTPQQRAYGGFAKQSTSTPQIGGKQVWELKGVLKPSTANTIASVGGQNGKRIVLGNDVIWKLDGAVVAGGDNADSVDLEIEAGTKVLGASGSYLVISRGSTIKAEGKKDKPIVFTSVEKGLGQTGAAGQWGGLVLLGNAPVNTCDNLAQCDASFEVGSHKYGGNKTDDNSGSLKYVRVEFGGFKVNDTQEMNGISFAAVGSKTEVSHIQIHENNDDGIEFWGGNVSVKNVVLTNNADDSLDWTNGWRGSAQHVYIRQKDNGSNRGIEADSNSSADAEPQSMPTIANVTIEVASGSIGKDDAEGILFRKGTGAKVYNTLVKGKVGSGECLEINHDNTVDATANGTLEMTHSLIDCAEPFKNAKAEKGQTKTLDVKKWFMDQQGNLAGASDLTGYMPNTSSVALTGGKADLINEDPRLVNAKYIGAFDGSNDWTKDWTTDIHVDNTPVAALPVLQACPEGTTSIATTAGLYEDANINLVCGLKGTIKKSVNLVAGKNVLYKLDGAVVVGGDRADSATLGIQAGTNIFGGDGSYLVVSRGSKILAQGSKQRPITMTSEKDVLKGAAGEAGQWGGLVLLGNGETNKCPDKNTCAASFEVGSHKYGGNDNADSSGQLSYLVVKYGGFKINDTQEMNGISFAAVGSGTQVDHIQIHANGDDGVEFWGGAVNLKYVYLTENFDDSLDWTNGWTGKAQHVYITHKDNGSNRGIEADSSSDASATPQSNPTLSNVTIEVGSGSNGSDKAEGILLRKGTAVKAHNVLIKGKVGSFECLEVNGDDTVNTANAGKLVMTHSVVDCEIPFKSIKNGETVVFDAKKWFMDQANNGEAEVALTKGMPAATDNVLLGKGKDMNADDKFFEKTNYIGAFDATNNWLEGWTFTPKQ
ncbi:MAG: hypothetical protein ACPGUD_02540 [Parashewanella sp.]